MVDDGLLPQALVRFGRFEVQRLIECLIDAAIRRRIPHEPATASGLPAIEGPAANGVGWRTPAAKINAVKKIFLAYSFAIPEIRAAVEAGCEGIATVIAADDRLRGSSLLVKITEMIEEADLSLFDLTGWNPNVAAEFGVAYARGVKWALLCSTDKKYQVRETSDPIFSDLGGVDSIQYPDFPTLTSELQRLVPEYINAPHVGFKQNLRMGDAAIIVPPGSVHTTIRDVDVAGHNFGAILSGSHTSLIGGRFTGPLGRQANPASSDRADKKADNT